MAAQKVQLDSGVAYRGRVIVLSPIGVTEDKVKQKFSEVGFKDVQVWLDDKSLPADWPAEAREDVAPFGNTQAWVQGTWDKPSGMYPSSGTIWEIYDYWPKDDAKPVAVDGTEKKSPIWIYGAVAGGVALVAVVVIAATSGD